MLMSRVLVVIAISLLSELVHTWPQLDALCQRRSILLASSSLFDLSHVVWLNCDWPTTEDPGDVVSEVVLEGDAVCGQLFAPG